MSRALLITLFLLLLTGQAAAQSIDLTPIRRVHGQDTTFCFTVPQARELAKLLTKKRFLAKETLMQQSLIEEQEGLLFTKNQIIKLQQDEIGIKSSQLAGRDRVIQMQHTAMQAQQDLLVKKDKELARQRRRTRWAWRVGLGLAGLALVGSSL